MMGPVLIVEDDPDIAEILRYVLENENLKTRIAHSGEEGLSAWLDKHNPPSLILLDLLLPGMSGIEPCRRLRRESLTRHAGHHCLSKSLRNGYRRHPATGNRWLHRQAVFGARDYCARQFSSRSAEE